MAKDLQSLIPLLTLSHGETTVSCAAWSESICSHGEQYEPHLFMFVFGGEEKSTTWKRVELYIDHAVIFPKLFPREGPINATVELVTKRDHECIIHRFDGVLTCDNDKIYLEPVRPALPTWGAPLFSPYFRMYGSNLHLTVSPHGLRRETSWRAVSPIESPLQNTFKDSPTLAP